MHAKLNWIIWVKGVESRLPGIPVVPHCSRRSGERADPAIPDLPLRWRYSICATGQALTVNEQGEDVVIPGLFAVGEIACVSVHLRQPSGAVTHC
ncbi:hypothetical protein KCP71_23730 [Salmonella enterica subsp. enterica]|nr:hypothetical protein KCP71_23730 [Salmonella enterica subsp. enterica]